MWVIQQRPCDIIYRIYTYFFPVGNVHIIDLEPYHDFFYFHDHLFSWNLYFYKYDSPARILQLVRDEPITTCPPCNWLEMYCRHLLLIFMTRRSKRNAWCWYLMGTTRGAQLCVFAWTPWAPYISCHQRSVYHMTYQSATVTVAGHIYSPFFCLPPSLQIRTLSVPPASA